MDRTCDPCRVKAFAAFRQSALYIGFGGNVTDERDNDPMETFPELHLDQMPCALHEMRNVWVSKTALVEDMHLVFVNGMQSLNGISRAVHPHAVTDAASYRRADRAASELKMLIAAARRLTGK